jgi:RNA polymerase sigma-70 factor (ECF subfamily)
MQDPDPVLLARARAGETDAFEDLVRAYQADVFRFSCFLTRDRDLAEEATQETFIRAFRFFGSFRRDARFSSWLLRIARNCCVDALRKQRRTSRDDLPLSAGSTGDAGVARAELDAALRSISPEHRQVFLLVEIFGLSYREVAEVLELEVGTVKSRMFRARKALCRALVDDEEQVR